MDLQIEAPDGSRYAAALRHAGRKLRRQIRLAGWAIFIFGVVLLVTPALMAPSVILPLRAAYAVAGGMLAALGFLMGVAPIRQGSIDPLSSQPCRFELTDTHLRLNSALYSAEFAWDAIALLEEIPGQLLFYTSKSRFISVPTAELSPPELAELRQFVAGRTGVADRTG
jgi:hypothetical protein